MSETPPDTEVTCSCRSTLPLFHSCSSPDECIRKIREAAHREYEAFVARDIAERRKEGARIKAILLQIPFLTSSRNGAELLLKNLNDTFENPQFSDVTLKVGDVEFPAHKIILANSSKVFDVMFKSGMKESHENVVNLVDVKPSITKEMLRYIYTGKIQDMSLDKAIDLFVVADRYDIPDLKKFSKSFLLRRISPEFVCEVAVLGDLHNDEDLKKAAIGAMMANMQAVLSSEKWSTLSEENPAFYLRFLQIVLLYESYYSRSLMYLKEEDFYPSDLSKKEVYFCSKSEESDEDTYVNPLCGSDVFLFDY